MKQWFRDLFQSKDKDRTVPVEASGHEAIAVNGEDASTKGHFYIADSPITDPALDRFGRWPFAQRVAQTIASRRDPSSIVIGIYGAWGEGKTTVLNFIENALGEFEDVICIRFNPWRFGDEIHLLQSFFDTLADALGKSISSRRETIAQWLRDYAMILAPVHRGIAESAREIGRTVSLVELGEYKNRIEKLLRDEGKRVVVLIDDIDRLDKAEIQTVFRLVKLSADFAYTAYVLAFDEDMVAVALGERFSSGDKEAGRSFIEKIVQVPLHLPMADRLSLRRLCFERIDEALREAEIDLTEDQLQAFARHFFDCLEIRIQTPRMAKRYANALVFSLPILKGEVNPVDLMLIEGIRVFYPRLYDVVRSNPEVFLGSLLDRHANIERAKQRGIEIINKGLEGLTSDESEAAKRLLLVLFPRLGGILGRTLYGRQWQHKWAEEQRIASEQHFNRFFSYSVPEGDVSDQELDSFLGRIESEPIGTVASGIQRLVGDRSADISVSKLRRKAEKLSAGTSRNLALAIASVGDIFPKPEQMFSFTTPFSQAGMLVSQLVENIPKGEDRFDVAKLIAQEGQPLSFAWECFRWMRATEEREEADRTLSVEEEDELGKIIADRIREFAQAEPIYIRLPRDAPSLLFVWSHWGSREETNQYLAGTLKKERGNVLELLKCYPRPAWGVESGLSHPGDFGREHYDSIARVVDTDTIYDGLYQLYGSDLDSPEYYDNDDRPLEERYAHQFAHIYHHVKTEEQGTPGREAEPER